ncbi:MAG: class I SAM-dependent methyltransferase [Nanoarchaeota archaeon]
MEMRNFEKFFVNSDFCNFFHKRMIFPSFFGFINRNLIGKLLEIGCGIGETTKLFTKKYNKLMITAIDYDKEQIQIAKKNKNLKNIKFFHGDATKLKFKNSSFDYVMETNTFHHIKNYSKAIKEVGRVLKDNGTFYLIDISRYVFIWPLCIFFPPESYFTKKEFIKNLENNGFRVEKSKCSLLFYIAARKI